MFLGTRGELENLKADSHKDISFNIVIKDKPLTEFVDIPSHLQGLSYNNIICGAIRGALNSVGIQYMHTFIALINNFHSLLLTQLVLIGRVFVLSDQLLGDERTVLRIEVKREKLKDDD